MPHRSHWPPRLNWLRPSLSWFLVFVPVAVLLDLAAPERATWVFVTSSIAIIPLAGWMGRATEQLATRTGEGIGGLLNATFGNAAELIIALMALREGLYSVVKASITGSIIGNLLLVLGASLLFGGMRHPTQRFNAAGARIQSTSLTLAAIALIVPMVYHSLAGAEAAAHEGDLSLEISIVLLATYVCSLFFALRTHKSFFVGHTAEAAAAEEEGPPWSLARALGVLFAATATIAWMSELLVGSVEHAALAFGMSDLFIGVVVVATVGNAAEHSTAILVARKNRMDLSLGIAIGSSLQIALFVAPLLVVVSYFLGPIQMGPMDLVFHPAEVLAVVVSVIIVHQIAGDGESNWLEGIQLLSVYLILVFVFYVLPAGVG